MHEPFAGRDTAAPPADSGRPLVSVVIPFYKQEAFLLETVNSVLQDGYPQLEIIVIDDGSPVPAAQVLPPDGPWRLIRTVNRGLSAARNRGLAESSGEFLLFLDSDDRLVPGGVASHLELLRRTPQAALSFGASATMNSQGVRVAPPTICRARSDYFLKLLEGNMIATPGAALIRRSVLLEAGGFDESFRMVEDYRLYLRLAIRHAFVRNARCVLERRIHGNNMSLNLEPMLAATMLALDKLQAEEHLTPEQRRKLAFGRRRWAHEYRPQSDLAYRLRSFYYDVRAMMDVTPVGLVRLREPRP
jgi:glycosyltransferase involved in cell wall biosynthesis